MQLLTKSRILHAINRHYICYIYVYLTIKIQTTMDNVEIVLNKMKELNAPVNATTLAAETGLDKKDVDKAMAQLKKEEKIFSPMRCKWQAK